MNTTASAPRPEVIGAWVMSAQWKRDPERSAAALRGGCPQLTHVALCLNDNADRRKNPDFYTFANDAAIIDAVRAYRAHGFVVELFSWLLPEPAFIAALNDRLRPLLENMLPEVARVHLDCEEAWSKGKGHAEAVNLLRLPADMTVTTYAGLLPHTSMRPLAARLDISWIVQCYATSSSKATPGAVQDYGAKMARKYLPGCTWDMGLPAYRQTATSARTQWDATVKLKCSEVWYWASSSLISGVVSKMLAGL